MWNHSQILHAIFLGHSECCVIVTCFLGYELEASLGYSTVQSFDTMLESGPLIRPGRGEVESEDVEEDEGPSAPQQEDIHALLVKAWEAKVFPVIQRRFRNDQERKSGLEQIKGALQLGLSNHTLN